MNDAQAGVVNIVRWASQQAVKLSKPITPCIIKSILKSAGFTWRRVRKSLQCQRDKNLFEFFKKELELLCAEAKKGSFRLWFYDETGFSLNPASVYAWQAPRKNSENSAFLPAKRGNVLTVAGFLGFDNSLEVYSQKAPMDACSFIAFVEDFIQEQVKNNNEKHVVVLDNASCHTALIVRHKMEEWKKQNLFFQFLPPYSSELNRIEILWRRIKHEWLLIKDFFSELTLENAVNNILKSFNTKYTINFS